MLCDLNFKPTEDAMKEFVKVENMKHLVKGPIFFKNSDKLSCIDLRLNNKSKSFQRSQIIETGITDFHKMIITFLNVFFEKKGPNIFLRTKLEIISVIY